MQYIRVVSGNARKSVYLDPLYLERSDQYMFEVVEERCQSHANIVHKWV